MSEHPAIFDGHNDVLSKLAGHPGDPVARFRSNASGHIDRARAARGGFAGGFFALWVPSSGTADVDYDAMAKERFDVPLPPAVAQPEALAAVMRQVSVLLRLAEAGLVTLCRTAGEVERATAGAEAGPLAALMHLEGAEAIDRDLAMLDVLHAAGLRSLGPVWSRPNRFGHGVPFRYPSGPDTGPGLTADGERLVDRCETLRILIDVSHMTEAGFWDVARRTRRPLVATHSNAHALTASARNLTDEQLDAVAASHGVVGLNFAAAFLRPDGRMLADVPLQTVLAHLDHLIARLGEDGVALGSDYDGALVPEALNGVDRLPALSRAMAEHGYCGERIEKICRRNWLRVLEGTIG